MARFVDAGPLVNWVRIVKSPQELTYMRQAGVIADRAMQTAIDTIAPACASATRRRRSSRR